IFTPLFTLVPVAATSAVLIFVGLFMISSIVNINFKDYKDALPAFITIVFIPFSYSISEGIVYGFLSFVIIRLLIGRFRDVSPIMYLLVLIFILKLILV
ncbi:MAG: NCS2 family permease, partial [Rikenellaceae bacterium]